MLILIISKLFNCFLLPPGLFIIFLIVAVIFYFIHRKKVFIILVLFNLLLLYLFSIEPVKNLLLNPLENYARKYGVRYNFLNSNKNKIVKNYSIKSSAIAVLGGGVYEKSPDFYNNASPMPDATKRVVYAYLLHKKTGMTIITSGGKRPGLKYSTPEGEVLKNLLVDLGVPQTKILVENSSRNTYENICNIKKIMKKQGFKHAFLVTSAYHMKRAMWICKSEGLKATPVPTDYKINRAGYTIESFLPSPLSFYDIRKTLHEYFGLLYYRIFY